METPEAMTNDSIFLFVSGAGSCVVVPRLLELLTKNGRAVYSTLTTNVATVTDPSELMNVTGNLWIRDYGDPPLDKFPFGVMLLAPCTFNTLNKVALGIADNLATSMIGDAIGAGCPMVVAPGMNAGQWANPRVAWSISQLEETGARFVNPRNVEGRLTLASVSDIAEAVIEVADQGLR